jgi:hypothetical protein
MTETSTPERNWAGNYTYRAEKLHRPQTLEELQEIVTKAPTPLPRRRSEPVAPTGQFQVVAM